MLVDRRVFLKAAGAGFLASLTPRGLHAAQSVDAVYASAYQRKGGGFGVAILGEDRSMIFSADLPDRGHDITFDPISRRSVVFARRPGTFAVAFDHTGRHQPQTISSVEGRHFFGHGVFSPDGGLLYATENDFENAQGMIGVYDATSGFARVGEFATHGMDPHDLLLLKDGRTMAIANGGIETHPDFGRAKLNIPTMKPSLVFIDRLTGELVEEHLLPPELHQLSIRHIDQDATGTVWFGCQYEGPDSDRPLLVGRARKGETFDLLPMPDKVISGFRNYIGSVAANPDAGTVAVSSPQGNSFAIIDVRTGAVVKSTDMAEVCGLAPDGSGFRATTGTGEIAEPDGTLANVPDMAWDNHLLRIR